MEIRETTESRNDLAKLFRGIGAEIGVERAIFSKTICRKNPETFLYLIDPWKAYQGYRDHVTQSKLDGFYNETCIRMAEFKSKVIRKFSVDAMLDFEDESLDFVFIDANHDYEHCMEDIKGWYKKVKKGGIVSGHDYIKRKGQEHLYGVKQAVNDFCEQNGIQTLFVYRGDSSPSWMFYK